MEIIIWGSVLLVALVFLNFRYSLLMPPKKGLAILMYHKISIDREDSLTIPVQKLEKQFEYLQKKNYRIIGFSNLLNNPAEIKTQPRPVILTFDDAYLSVRDLLLPLLEKFGFKAAVFVPSGFMGKTNEWDHDTEPVMSAAILAGLDKKFIETGLHGFEHVNYRHIPADKIRTDIRYCISALQTENIDFIPVLAYPYGGFPREKETFQEFQNILHENGIKMGLRIGNKINPLPLKNVYEVKRIDIKGTDSFFEFKTKLKKGRVKRF